MIGAISPVLLIGDRVPTSSLPSRIQSATPSPSNKATTYWVDAGMHAMEAAIGKLDIIRILRDGYVQQAHNWRRPVTRAVVQAYQVWKKRLQVSERLAVKRKAIGIMEEVGPAPLEEVFLMEELLPAPLKEAPPTPPPAYTSPPKSACGQSIDVKDRGIDYGCSDQQPTECVTDHAFLVQLQCQSQSPPPLTASACC